MNARANKLLVTTVCIAAALAPVFTNLVLCIADNDHVAFELAHQVYGCIEIAHGETSRTVATVEAPCEDVSFPGDDLVLHVRDFEPPDFKSNLIPSFQYLLLSSDTTNSFFRISIPRTSPPSGAIAPSAGVCTTVLLI